MLGSATAAYQVEGAWNEGGCMPSIWDDYCRKHSKVACANVANDFYHHSRDDVKLMVVTGLQSSRFSVSWSRAMNWDPETKRMRSNPPGLAFCHPLIDTLKAANNIVPILTLCTPSGPQMAGSTLRLSNEVGDGLRAFTPSKVNCSNLLDACWPPDAEAVLHFRAAV